MTFGSAYDPIRALKNSWLLLKKAPGTVLVGGILLLFMDGGCGGGGGGSGGGGGGGGGSGSGGGGGLSGGEAALIFFIVAGVIMVAVGLWLFGCLLKVGFPAALEHTLKTGQDEVGRVFRGGGRWLQMVLGTFLQALASLAALIPLGVLAGGGALIGLAADNEAVTAGLAIGGALIGIPIFIYIALGISLVPEAIAIEGFSATDSFGRSWELVAGNRLQLIVFHIVTGLFALVGVLACCIGVLFTGALAVTAQYDAYLHLVRSREEQKEWIALE